MRLDRSKSLHIQAAFRGQYRTNSALFKSIGKRAIVKLCDDISDCLIDEEISGIDLRLVSEALRQESQFFGRRDIARRGGVLVKLQRELKAVFSRLQIDLEKAILTDPVKPNREEVILTYPGFQAIMIYRVANILNRHEFRLIARLWTDFAKRETGVDIHPGASIAAGCSIDHGEGVVIGETSVVGSNVVIFHGVTLGARNPPQSPRDFRGREKRHPTIG